VGSSLFESNVLFSESVFRAVIAAAAATSWRDRADSFFLILKAKRDFGANFARASWNLSVRLLIAYEWIREP
jgi:hypothetical protein